MKKAAVLVCMASVLLSGCSGAGGEKVSQTADSCAQAVSSDDSTPAAEFICGQIASADAAWHDGSEEFAQVMKSCKADYPEGPAAELLSKMETAHEASLERNK